MKTLTLDVSKWRCGTNSSNPNNTTGLGATALLNDKGYMCCIGQFAPQLNPSITQEEMLNLGSPQLLKTQVPLMTVESRMFGEVYSNTVFTGKALLINDNEHTTLESKIDSLYKLLKEHEYQLNII